KKPPLARVLFRVDGGLSPAAELLDSDALRGSAAISLDPAATRGTIAAQVSLSVPIQKPMPPRSIAYAITADISSFASDKRMTGQKLEATQLQVTATNAGYQ